MSAMRRTKRAQRRHQRRKKIERNKQKIEEENAWGSEGHPWRLTSGIPSIWRRLRKRIRKAKEKHLLRQGKFDIPKWKNNDVWDWW